MTANGGHVGIVPVGAEAHNLHVGLVHVFLVDEVDAGLGAGEVDRGAAARA